MKYRLGLDLGVGSIGSAIIELDEQNNAKKIIDAGVRIFEVSEGAEERRLRQGGGHPHPLGTSSGTRLPLLWSLRRLRLPPHGL